MRRRVQVSNRRWTLGLLLLLLVSSAFGADEGRRVSTAKPKIKSRTAAQKPPRIGSELAASDAIGGDEASGDAKEIDGATEPPIFTSPTASSGVSPPSPPLPPSSTPPKPRPSSLSSFSSLSLRLARAAPMSGTAAAALKAFDAAKPFLTNPLHLSKGKQWFVGMFLLSLWFLLQSLTSVVTMVVNPVGFTTNLCFGTALFKASFFALHGPSAQTRSVLSVERLPYTMLTFSTLAAALYVALDNKRFGSLVFGWMHLAAFLVDVCSHVKGGAHVAKWVLSRYLALLRFILGRFGIRYETPGWIKAMTAPPPPPKQTTKSSGSMLSYLTSSLGMGGASEPGRSKRVDKLALRPCALLLQQGEQTTLPPNTTLVGARLVSAAEMQLLRGVGVSAEASAWRPTMLRGADDAQQGRAADSSWWVANATVEADESGGVSASDWSLIDGASLLAREGGWLHTPLRLSGDALLAQLAALHGVAVAEATLTQAHSNSESSTFQASIEQRRNGEVMVNASQNIQIQRTPSIETRHNRMRRLSEVHGDPREGEEEFPEDATVIDVTAKVDPEIAELEDGDDNVFDFDGDDDADDVLDVSKVVTGHAGTAPNETQWVGVLLLVRQKLNTTETSSLEWISSQFGTYKSGLWRGWSSSSEAVYGGGSKLTNYTKGWLARTGDWVNAKVNESISPLVAEAPSDASRNGGGADATTTGSAQAQAQAQAARNAALLSPMTAEDWAAARRLGESVTSWGSRIQRDTGSMFVEISTWGFSWMQPQSSGCKPQSSTKKRKTNKKRSRSAVASSKLLSAKKRKSKAGEQTLGGDKRAKKNAKKTKNGKAAQQPQVQVASLRSGQLLALAMAREHQIQLMGRFAAAVASADPDLARNLNLGDSHATMFSMMSRTGGAMPPGPGSGAPQLPGSMPFYSDPEGGGSEESDVQLSDVRELVPYGFNPHVSMMMGSRQMLHKAEYAEFLMTELRRLLDEGVPVRHTQRRGAANTTRLSSKRKGAKRVSAARKRSKSETIVTLDTARALSDGVASATSRLGSEMKGVASRLWSMWAPSDAGGDGDSDGNAVSKQRVRPKMRRSQREGAVKVKSKKKATDASPAPGSNKSADSKTRPVLGSTEPTVSKKSKAKRPAESGGTKSSRSASKMFGATKSGLRNPSKSDPVQKVKRSAARSAVAVGAASEILKAKRGTQAPKLQKATTRKKLSRKSEKVVKGASEVVEGGQALQVDAAAKPRELDGNGPASARAGDDAKVEELMHTSIGNDDLRSVEVEGLAVPQDSPTGRVGKDEGDGDGDGDGGHTSFDASGDASGDTSAQDVVDSSAPYEDRSLQSASGLASDVPLELGETSAAESDGAEATSNENFGPDIEGAVEGGPGLHVRDIARPESSWRSSHMREDAEAVEELQEAPPEERTQSLDRVEDETARTPLTPEASAPNASQVQDSDAEVEADPAAVLGQMDSSDRFEVPSASADPDGTVRSSSVAVEATVEESAGRHAAGLLEADAAALDNGPALEHAAEAARDDEPSEGSISGSEDVSQDASGVHTDCVHALVAEAAHAPLDDSRENAELKADLDQQGVSELHEEEESDAEDAELNSNAQADASAHDSIDASEDTNIGDAADASAEKKVKEEHLDLRLDAVSQSSADAALVSGALATPDRDSAEAGRTAAGGAASPSEGNEAPTVKSNVRASSRKKTKSKRATGGGTLRLGAGTRVAKKSSTKLASKSSAKKIRTTIAAKRVAQRDSDSVDSTKAEASADQIAALRDNGPEPGQPKPKKQRPVLQSSTGNAKTAKKASSKPRRRAFDAPLPPQQKASAAATAAALGLSSPRKATHSRRRGALGTAPSGEKATLRRPSRKRTALQRSAREAVTVEDVDDVAILRDSGDALPRDDDGYFRVLEHDAHREDGRRGGVDAKDSGHPTARSEASDADE